MAVRFGRKTCFTLAIAALMVGTGSANAAFITLIGTDFNLTYDDTKLGLFGAPTLTGDIISFTFNEFTAQSLNGVGFVTANSTISGLELDAKNGFTFGQLLLGEFGDYTMTGSLSAVAVQGQLRAYDINDSLFTQTAADLVVNPATPLNIIDGANHDWQSSSLINNSTPVSPPLFGGAGHSGWLNTANKISLTIENRISAFTSPGALFAQQAFIEKKFAGVAISVMPVPEPASFLGMLAGLVMLGGWTRRRLR